MSLPTWLRRTLQRATRRLYDDDRPNTRAPRDVRLVDVHGVEFPVEVKYVGWDGTVHEWEIVGGLPEAGEWAPPAPRLYVGLLPAMTSITFPAVPFTPFTTTEG